MLHSLKDGPCSESFGIHVANMAHFPTSVIEAAKRKAAELEQSEELHLGEGEDEGGVFLETTNIHFLKEIPFC